MTSNNKESLSIHLKGPIAAPFTPFLPNGEINFDVLEDYISRLLADGVTSVFVNGTTGEGLSMTMDERKALAEKWIALGKNKFQAVIIHIGAASLKEIQELARHAEEHGADAVSTIPPLFHKPHSMEDLVNFLEQAASAAPNTPFFYYHNPHMVAHCNFSVDKLVFHAFKSNRIPTFSGIKYSSEKLLDYGLCHVHFPSHCQVMYGCDEQLLPALTLGGDAFIGSTYNYLARVANKILKAFKEGDMVTAREEQYRIQSLVTVLIKHGGHVGVNKTIMSLTGLEMGPSRSPLSTPSPSERTKIRAELESIGFFDWIK